MRLPKAKWGKEYTSKQLEAIHAAQEVIPQDAFDKGRNPSRVDPWSIEYYDNLDKIDPIIDKPVLAPWENIDDTSRLKEEEEIEDDLAKMVENPPETEEEAAGFFQKFDRSMRLTVGNEAHERNPRSAMAPIPPPPPKKKTTSSSESPEGKGKRYEEEPSPALVRLMQMTGYSREHIAKLRVKSLISHRVMNQTRLGKIGKTYFLSVAGNGDGLLGIGEGKSEESSEARLQSQYRAIRNMMPILRYEKRTIYGDVKAKVSATELELMARPPGMYSSPSFYASRLIRSGFGLRCQQYIWEMCKCAGIHDLAARVTRARNPMNTVKAAYDAILKQKDPEDIARARGKKLVDVRRVYYAGQV